MGLVLVTAPDCHLCEHAQRVLGRLAAELGLAVQRLDWDDTAAVELRRDSAPAFPPALYAEGRLIAYGRLSEAALRRRLRPVSGS